MTDLNSICEMTKNPTVLNALHACRDGHPLNNANSFKHAWFLASQHRDIPSNAVEWLRKQAKID